MPDRSGDAPFTSALPPRPHFQLCILLPESQPGAGKRTTTRAVASALIVAATRFIPRRGDRKCRIVTPLDPPSAAHLIIITGVDAIVRAPNLNQRFDLTSWRKQQTP